MKTENQQSWFLEKINKIDKTLITWTKTKEEKTQIAKNKKWVWGATIDFKK